MIEILQNYWQALLWTDGHNITGLAMTLWILILSILIGGILSVFLAIGRNSPNKFIKLPIWLFTYVFRGTPLYVQLLVIYTGIYTLSIVKNHPWLSDFFQSGLNCTILAFTLNTCAYTTEVFAGAIRNVPEGEIEAATALGFNHWQLYQYIIFPRAFHIALPAYSNEVIFMLHSTALAFTVTVQDVMKIARDIYVETYQPFHAFGIAAIIYLCVSFVLIFGFKKLEKHCLAYQHQ
ncbi:histidine ABC transporter permease HisM [Gilliamella sp. B2776]|uniref:histidine ABC transporter permease HisM n=1 Tax=unclassified Gilliamella TaxID=2685620 RepID=UPI002269D81B|nr:MULTISPECIES: histidine ABC transporter permease HisM [unclassified Gilliamella]MCX8650094.1 histidine ABC transporter permease HisM [Gilliamella sp. B2779]MCX8655027.1 histidine ABC transporter permease HisM [Gilliamella sp. B2737]MCX8656625.1 histidine ABC transporter permease HisM [Gilliamella sp. B2894]MCX8691867.1 histidine ABC transporter permease HisM [Gilliamella sp. B2776]MCX8693063.1 histidine ABC transporter permease HisM [Gilliamella sp. B2881]